MPIYAYLCPHCNRIYDFLSRTPTPRRDPVCPRCGATDLAKQVTRFAVVRGGRGDDDDLGPGEAHGDPDPLDDPRTAAELERLMADAESIDDDNPRELGRFMRRMTELAGEPLTPDLDEALRRLEAGEDPDRVEDDLGDVLGELPPDGTHAGAAGDAAFAPGAAPGDPAPAAPTSGGDGSDAVAGGVRARPPRGRPVKDRGLYDL